MIYLLSEDSKSGPIFWNSMLSTQGVQFQVVPHNGCNHLLNSLCSVPQKSRANDSICIISVDYANLSILEPLEQVLPMVQENMPCFTTKYLCVESAILLALKDLDMLKESKIPEECSAAIQQFIQCAHKDNFEEFWNFDINYDTTMLPFYQSVLYYKSVLQADSTLTDRRRYQGYTTLEQAVAGLLSRTTQGTGFKFTKSDIGKCWTKDCCWGVNEVGEQFAKPCTLTELLTQKEKADKIIDSSGFNNCISDISGNRMGLRDVINLAAQLEAEAEDQEESNFGITHEFV